VNMARVFRYQMLGFERKGSRKTGEVPSVLPRGMATA
jgi:hypothetical protein